MVFGVIVLRLYVLRVGLYLLEDVLQLNNCSELLITHMPHWMLGTHLFPDSKIDEPIPLLREIRESSTSMVSVWIHLSHSGVHHKYNGRHHLNVFSQCHPPFSFSPHGICAVNVAPLGPDCSSAIMTGVFYIFSPCMYTGSAQNQTALSERGGGYASEKENNQLVGIQCKKNPPTG